jgi:FkbM family methyltransferase
MSLSPLMSRLQIRDQFERDACAGVIDLDEYRLRALRDRGFTPKTIVDIGGHIGSFALMASSVWPNARIISVEPAPECYSRLNETVGGMPNVCLENSAMVGSGYGRRTIDYFRSLDGNTAGGSTMRRNHGVPVRVNAITILDLIQRWQISRIDLLKLDCEGEEGAILKDLSDAGIMQHVCQIAGEWHEFDSIPVIENALRATHDLELYRESHPWGAFFARPH